MLEEMQDEQWKMSGQSALLLSPALNPRCLLAAAQNPTAPAPSIHTATDISEAINMPHDSISYAMFGTLASIACPSSSQRIRTLYSQKGGQKRNFGNNHFLFFSLLRSTHCSGRRQLRAVGRVCADVEVISKLKGKNLPLSTTISH